MTKILCPFCLEKHDFSRSLECPNVKNVGAPGSKATVPIAYVNEYNDVPPLYITTVGFSNHGKTSFLASFTLVLENLFRVWTNSFYRVLDQRTQDFVERSRKEAYWGTVPPITAPSMPHPLFISLYELPKFGSNCVVLYDIAGELYDSFQGFQNPQLINPVNASQNIWFLVSLQDLLDNPGRKINDLLTTYISGMEHYKSSLLERNLIVVFTKADKIIHNLKYQIPLQVRDYLLNDPFQNIEDYAVEPTGVDFWDPYYVDNYLAEMSFISEGLRDYVKRRVPGGNAFIKLAESKALNLRFSMVSSLGSDLTDKRLKLTSSRFRVIDPLFWTFYLNQRPVSQSVSMTPNQTPIKVFLCHSSRDKPAVRMLYRRLSAEDWIAPWLDEEDLLPGMNWDSEIKNTVRSTDVVIVCLSKESINKDGYVQKEIRQALDIADEKPENTIFIIPLKLEECNVPGRLSQWHWLDYFGEGAYEKLIQSLIKRSEALGFQRK